jgi:hypothetical protein
MDVHIKPMQTNLSGSPSTLLLGDFFDRALNFWDIESSALDINHVPENGLDFGKFVLVASDEVDCLYTTGHGGGGIKQKTG